MPPIENGNEKRERERDRETARNHSKLLLFAIDEINEIKQTSKKRGS